MIPDYDVDWWAQSDNPFDRTGTMHFPIFVQSRMLNVAVSYYWAPLFDSWSQELLSRWDKPPYTNTPDYIFFGTVAPRFREELEAQVINCSLTPLFANPFFP